MKKCPFCAEEIKLEAKLCKHCGKNITETEKPWYRKNISSGWILFIIIAVGFTVYTYNSSTNIKDSSSFNPKSYVNNLKSESNIHTTVNATKTKEKIPLEKILDFKVISSQSLGNTMAEVKVKITNLTNKGISNAQVTCILKGKDGKEIAFQKHYAIKSTEGGLAAKQSTYFTYIIDIVNYYDVETIAFHIDELNF